MSTDRDDTVRDLASILASLIAWDQVSPHAYKDRLCARLGISEDDGAEAVEEVLRRALGPTGKAPECAVCGERITLLGGAWTTGDGTIACTDTSAAFVAHKPKEG